MRFATPRRWPPPPNVSPFQRLEMIPDIILWSETFLNCYFMIQQLDLDLHVIQQSKSFPNGYIFCPCLAYKYCYFHVKIKWMAH